MPKPSLRDLRDLPRAVTDADASRVRSGAGTRASTWDTPSTLAAGEASWRDQFETNAAAPTSPPARASASAPARAPTRSTPEAPPQPFERAAPTPSPPPPPRSTRERNSRTPADVCLFIEGAYPYVTGGVSQWVQDLVTAQRHTTFHIVALVADDTPRVLRYKPPSNVLSLRNLVLQHHEPRCPTDHRADALMQMLGRPLNALMTEGGREPLAEVMQALQRYPEGATMAHLLNSEAAFELVQHMVSTSVPQASFLHYFWSWRSLLSGLFSVLLSRVPEARAYHAVSTGYAGIAMARAAIATGRPGLLTEHGIYTNERRIEIAMADWLQDHAAPSLSVDDAPPSLRDVWMRAFISHSRTSYESANRIITLFEGNQVLQARDGAMHTRMAMVPNGIDVRHFRAIQANPRPRRVTVALVGRVVPIKDIKTYIRAAAILRDLVPGVRVLMIGPRDEDPEYNRECTDMVAHLGLGDTFAFKGPVPMDKVLPFIDVLVLTSLSEAQPLVMLEAGAAGIACVATDVGACRDILHGRSGEYPKLPHGGIVTPLANPLATAQAIAQLLHDDVLRQRCGQALRERVRRYYNQKMVQRTYREIYLDQITKPSTQLPLTRHPLMAA
jgi:polysaccharide biosynthesis protein PelF